jgi:hypothetical protein
MNDWELEKYFQDNSNKDYSSWIEPETGYLHLNPEVVDSENGILFLAEAAYLDEQFYKYLPKAASHYESGNDRNYSHDNTTAYLAICYLLGISPKMTWKMWRQYLHPRDIAFWLVLKGGFAAMIGYLPLFIAMFISCLRTHKTRNGVKFIHTDGKKLSYLRCRAADLVSTWELLNKILVNKFGKYPMHQVYSIYFKNPKHPMRYYSGIWKI